ncbi:hypothetical protein BOTBODRAFT_175176 [Botryobasidium botryosum FD-172 SS1]|uniref:Carbohydrate-binding module family 13 protein n=1 Tax=Botryobasidium botryosum (strain FD-172 SS1) TaxID=930990 RepID=A0A067MQA2_BOTB1|nr:hypothetical protein BOTBODRAFT_175176 [Botryobasidium botryosum FD-172 SS1]
MSQIPNGLYTIGKYEPSQLITLLSDDKMAVFLPPIGNPGEREWVVQRSRDGAHTIEHPKSGKYLSFEGDPEVNKPIIVADQPKEWELRQSARPQTFHLVVPGGPVQGDQELALDLSLLRIFPPQLALRPLNQSNDREAWHFQSRE